MQGLWGDLDISVTLSEKFSDDFLLVDDLDDSNDDLEPYAFDASTVFDESNLESCSTLLSENLPTTEMDLQDHSNTDSIKKTRGDRSRSPSPKRRRSIAPMVVSPSPVKSCATMSMSPSSAKSCASPPMTSLHDLEIQYKLAIEQLTISMRRSEMTRSEIISFRRAENASRECQEREAPLYASSSIADDVFTQNSQSTLTVGLTQSRQMLKDYMNMNTTLHRDL